MAAHDERPDADERPNDHQRATAAGTGDHDLRRDRSDAPMRDAVAGNVDRVFTKVKGLLHSDR